MTRYRKAWAAFTAAVLATITILWDVKVSESEAVVLATSWLGVASVYFFPNDAPAGEHPDPNVSERG